MRKGSRNMNKDGKKRRKKNEKREGGKAWEKHRERGKES
jgi:hypothetical protein